MAIWCEEHQMQGGGYAIKNLLLTLCDSLVLLQSLSASLASIFFGANSTKNGFYFGHPIEPIQNKKRLGGNCDQVSNEVLLGGPASMMYHEKDVGAWELRMTRR